MLSNYYYFNLKVIVKLPSLFSLSFTNFEKERENKEKEREKSEYDLFSVTNEIYCKTTETFTNTPKPSYDYPKQSCSMGLLMTIRNKITIKFALIAAPTLVS